MFDEFHKGIVWCDILDGVIKLLTMAHSRLYGLHETLWLILCDVPSVWHPKDDLKIKIIWSWDRDTLEIPSVIDVNF